MRKAINMRFDPDLLALARLQAARENRSLTNFVETAVRQRVADGLLPTAAFDVRTGAPLTTSLPADQDA
jgi:uncharacterized protein (DUF1778 family)